MMRIVYPERVKSSSEITLAKYKDVIELKSAGHRVMTSQMLGDDGTWSTVMTANYHRKK